MPIKQPMLCQVQHKA